jgi:SPP1 gp7 family putative phage head morphogenesis protein
MWDTFFEAVRFKEAVAWFRSRVPMTDAEYKALTKAAQLRAFTVAGVAQLDLVSDVWEALEKAVSAGTTLQDFKKTVGERLATAWGGKDPHRLEIIFRTNVQSAYSAGRYEQMTHPDVLTDRPVWMFDAVFDSRTSPICKECDNVRLPAGHPWWKTHIPPLHFGCRSAVTTMSAEEADESGGLSQPPNTNADQGFGAPATSGKDWQPDKKDYPPELWNAYEASHRPKASKRSGRATP